jgi:hypothetical protein
MVFTLKLKVEDLAVIMPVLLEPMAAAPVFLSMPRSGTVRQQPSPMVATEVTAGMAPIMRTGARPVEVAVLVVIIV